jgi:TAG lipase / steryl ester hydrolase / phospholipase A2 / LPA acyltransferase
MPVSTAVQLPAAQQASRRPDPRVARQPSTALLLSGGGNFGWFHLGVIKVLLENQILPRIISGSSAGSLIAALIGTRRNGELESLKRDQLGLLDMVDRQEGRATSDGFRAALEILLPDVTFAEAREISGRSINISIANAEGGGLNCGPDATPDVLIRDAVRASCAVPLAFDPVVVQQRKRGRTVPFQLGRTWVDGSLYADIPAGAIKSRYGVRHTIVSMVNPVARPFFGDGVPQVSRCRSRRLMLKATQGAALRWVRVSRAWAVPLPRVRRMFDIAHGVIRQSYSGDIVLTPSRRFLPLSSMLAPPTRDMVCSLAADGEVRTRHRVGDLKALSLA